MGGMPDVILEATGLDGPGFLYGAVAVLAGAWLKGYTGFGASMLWMTSLSLLLPPLQVVPMVLMFEVVTSIALLPRIWKDVRWRSIGLLLLGTWAATPAGIHALSSLPAAPIRVALAAVVFIAVILILRGFALAKEPGRVATAGVGLMAGALNGSMGIRRPAGDPVLLLLADRSGRGRASIIAYVIGTDSVGTLMFAAQGLIDTSVYWRTAVFAPILIAGVAAGNRGFVRTDPETFRKVALFVLMALSVLLFARALWPA